MEVQRWDSPAIDYKQPRKVSLGSKLKSYINPLIGLSVLVLIWAHFIWATYYFITETSKTGKNFFLI